MEDTNERAKSTSAVFQPPMRSRATRTPPVRSKASGRGQVPARTRLDRHTRVRHFESKLEQSTLYLLIARADVVDVWDQPPAVTYQHADGRIGLHVFDFLVTLRCGKRLAIAVKPAAIVARNAFRETLKRIKAGTPLSFAEDIILITDQSFTRADAHNARRLHEFRRYADPDADRAVLREIKRLKQPCRIRDIVVQTGLEGRAFRAVFRAIYSGQLSTLDAGFIAPSTRVVREDVA